MKLIWTLYLLVMTPAGIPRYESTKKNKLVRKVKEALGEYGSFLPKKWITIMFSPCLLLVHNDVKLLEDLEAALRRAGYRVLTANTSRQATYLAQAVLPEVIICDVDNDLHVRNTLAQDAQTAVIPFIHLTKALDQHELVASVNALVRSYAPGNAKTFDVP